MGYEIGSLNVTIRGGHNYSKNYPSTALPSYIEVTTHGEEGQKFIPSVGEVTEEAKKEMMEMIERANRKPEAFSFKKGISEKEEQ